MSRQLYKRIAPHLQRVSYDNGVTSNNIQDFFKLNQANEELGNDLKLFYCPEVTGNKIRTSSGYNYVSKGYSANNIASEFGKNLISNGDFSNSLNSWNYQNYQSSSISVENNKCRFIYNSVDSFYHNIDQTITPSLKMDGFYMIELNIEELVTGRLKVQSKYGSIYPSYIIDRVGVHKFIIQVDSSNFQIARYSSNESVNALIDNIRMYEVVQNDLYQTVDTNQPILDKITPIEKYSVKNGSGSTRFLRHPTIELNQLSNWTIELVFNNHSLGNNEGPIGHDSNNSGLAFNYNGIYGVLLWGVPSGSNRALFYNMSKHCGKTTVLHIVNSDNVVKLFINGVFIGQTNSIGLVLNRIFTSRYNNVYSYSSLYSLAYIYKKLSNTDISNRASILKSIFPEVPSVIIGGKEWSVRNFESTITPQSNIIPEIQNSNNVEMITNIADREFSSDTGFWNKGAGISISDGVCHFVSSEANIGISKTLLVINKWYKITFTISNYVSGSLRAVSGNFLYGTYSSNGTYNIYAMAGSTSFALWGVSTVNTLDIDNVSVKEISWSSSQELYDGIYSQTSGTIEQKTYEAVKAAAMWCNWNNDAAFGVIYGKLYNWFAVKLLQMDIDYYNAANPSTPWGWRVPTSVDYNFLITNLGGSSIAGGKMKLVDSTFWGGSNIGATNESGFSSIMSNYRLETGGFSGGNCSLWDLDSIRWALSPGGIDISIAGVNKSSGRSVRLIRTN